MRLGRESAGAEAFPLERAQSRLAGSRTLDGEEGRAAALALGLPPARLRELAALYPELTRAATEVRVCAGTSCFLTGGTALAAALPGAHPVHCLGHCDRSPCVASLATVCVVAAIRAGEG